MAVQNADRPEPPTFPAAYPGDCSECGDGFDQGELIRADRSGDWCHAWCPEDPIGGRESPFTGTTDAEMGY